MRIVLLLSFLCLIIGLNFFFYKENDTSSILEERIEHAKPLNDPIFTEAIDEGDAQWGIGKDQCQSLFVYKDPRNGIAARGDTPGCNVYFNESWVDEIRELLRGTYEQKTTAYLRLCVTATHERGHNLGYHHSKDKSNIMYYAGAVTAGCNDWAVQKAGPPPQSLEEHLTIRPS